MQAARSAKSQAHSKPPVPGTAVAKRPSPGGEGRVAAAGGWLHPSSRQAGLASDSGSEGHDFTHSPNLHTSSALGPTRARLRDAGGCGHDFHCGRTYELIKATWNLKVEASQNCVSASWCPTTAWRKVPSKEGPSRGLGFPASPAGPPLPTPASLRPGLGGPRLVLTSAF